MFRLLPRILNVQCKTRVCSVTYSTHAETSKTHFGYEEVDENEKQEKVQSVFTRVAQKYDIMNDAMSAGAHRLWKDYFVFRLGATKSTRLIDVAGGTGDIAFRFLKHLKLAAKDDLAGFSNLDVDMYDSLGSGGHVTVFDLNQGMLNVGKQRAQASGYTEEEMSWVCGNAEKLPFEDNSFDAFTIAFGIRNCTHIDKVIQEAHRVLAKGGRFMCLEFSRPTNTLLSKMYDTYSMQVIPVMGHLIAGDYDAYQYLVQSIRRFPDQETFKEMIESAGFKNVSYENLSQGIVAVHSGFKL